MKKLSIMQVHDKLNQFLAADPLAITHLANLKVDCGPLQMSQSGIVSEMSYYDRPLMGLVEVLNSIYDDRQQLRAVFVGDKLVKFVLQSKPRPARPPTKVVESPKVLVTKPVTEKRVRRTFMYVHRELGVL